MCLYFHKSTTLLHPWVGGGAAPNPAGHPPQAPPPRHKKRVPAESQEKPVLSLEVTTRSIREVTVSRGRVNERHLLCSSHPPHPTPPHSVPARPTDPTNVLRAVPCRAVPCRAVPCRAVPCRAVPCRAVPRRAVPPSTSSENEAPPGATDEQYSPPQLVSALREVSARSAPLGVEGIFSAMAKDDVFMNEVHMYCARIYLCRTHGVDKCVCLCVRRVGVG